MRLCLNTAPLIATGNVQAHHPYDPATGRGAVAQGTNDSGVPLWQVEVLRRDVEYDRPRMVTELVTVPSPSAPKVDEFEPIGERLTDLTVDVTVNRKSGGLRVNWTASGITPALKRAS